MRVQNIMNKNNRAVPNQFIISDGQSVSFQSYASTIATIKDGVLRLSPHWNYSRTTLKYLYEFLRDNGMGLIATGKTLQQKIDKGEIKVDLSI